MSASQEKTKKVIAGGPWFLALLTLAFCMSVVMVPFAPFPLTFMILVFDRVKGYLVSLATGIVAYFLSYHFSLGPFLFLGFLTTFLFSVILAEIFFRKWSPMNGLLRLGIPLASLFLITLGVEFYSAKKIIYESITTQVKQLEKELKKDETQFLEMQGEEAREFLDKLSHPDEVAKDIVGLLPRAILIGIFGTLWLNLLMLLRSLPSIKWKLAYPYQTKDLVFFKVPEIFVWPVILGLFVWLLGEDYVGAVPFFIGKNIIYAIGIFYFFQGFGVLQALLNRLRWRGILRSFLVILLVFSFYWLIALIGLFDLWFDFRKFFTHKKIQD